MYVCMYVKPTYRDEFNLSINTHGKAIRKRWNKNPFKYKKYDRLIQKSDNDETVNLAAAIKVTTPTDKNNRTISK